MVPSLADRLPYLLLHKYLPLCYDFKVNVFGFHDFCESLTFEDRCEEFEEDECGYEWKIDTGLGLVCLYDSGHIYWILLRMMLWSFTG
jgi:hypothetical protein